MLLTLLAAAPDLACDVDQVSPLCELLHAAESGPAPIGPRLGLAFECEAELRVAQADILTDAHVAVLQGETLFVVDAPGSARDELVGCLQRACSVVDGQGAVTLAHGADAVATSLYRARAADTAFLVAVSEARPGDCGWVAVFPDVPVR